MTSSLSPRARSEYVATVLSSTPGAAVEVTPGSLHHRRGPHARALGAVRTATACARGRRPRVGTLAGIRRVDSAFVVNVDAGTRAHAGQLRHLVREQPATMTVHEF